MVGKPDSKHTSSRGRFWGGILLGAGAFWLIWLLFFYHPVSSTVSQWPQPGATPLPATTSSLQFVPLVAAGITLYPMSPPSTMSQTQALQIANLLEPDAAVGAQKVSIYSVSLTYLGASRGAKDLHAVPVWMIYYQHIPQPQSAVALDKGSEHDLSIFLDPRTGNSVLSVWS